MRLAGTRRLSAGYDGTELCRRDLDLQSCGDTTWFRYVIQLDTHRRGQQHESIPIRRPDHCDGERLGGVDGWLVYGSIVVPAANRRAGPSVDGVRVMHRRHGQALPEFAIVVPLFLLLLFGLIDFSRMLFTYISITNGARELARVVTITGPWVLPQATCTTCVTNTVDAFNNLTILGGPATGVQNFSLSPGSGTISCASVTSSGWRSGAHRLCKPRHDLQPALWPGG